MRTKSAGQSALLLLDVIDILGKNKIPYAIIGAFAASFYGVVRASLDADAVISVSDFNEAAELCKGFRARGLEVKYRRGDVEDPVGAVINIQDRFSNRVDLLMGIKGMAPEVFSRVHKTRFMGDLIKIVGLEDFIAMKIFAGGPKDIQDAAGVLNISGKKIDLQLLKKVTARYGTVYLKKLQSLLEKRPSRK